MQEKRSHIGAQEMVEAVKYTDKEIREWTLHIEI